MKVAERASGLIVVDADDMYDFHFIKHFEIRHTDQLKGIDRILLPHDELTIRLYREFHHKIHQYPYLFPFAERNHEHEGITIYDN